MYRPKITFADSPPYGVYIRYKFGIPVLGVGDQQENQAMIFSATVYSRNEFLGKIKAVQLINRWWSRWPGVTGGTGGSFYLDADPYPDSESDIFLFYNPPHNSSTVTDAPYISMQECAWMSASDQFKTYFMFQPNGEGNIWITLGRADWNWYGNAELVGQNWMDVDSWSLTSGNVGGPFFYETSEFPIWEYNL